MENQRGLDNLQSITHDDPSTKIWTSYISAAEKHDKDLVRGWKGDMDAILIFAGLFSATVTSFIIESYKTLTPDTDDIMISLLAQISQQLMVTTSNTTFTPIALSPDPFIPPPSSLVCNTLFFLSLGFSLFCALSATLVEQWVRNYLQATESRPVPHERARIFSFLSQGLEKFKMAALVEAIPMLLHISLLLFFAGLIEFLRPVNSTISNLMLAILASCGALYGLATLIPVFRRDCPYQTPLSGVWWSLMKALHLLRRPDPQHGGTKVIVGTMAQEREADALEISPERDQRDLEAMCWTLKSLRQDMELEPFLEIIPKVVAGFDYSAKLLLNKLLFHEDLSVRLSHRIPRLLVTVTHTNGAIDPALSQRHAAACLAAIWSLTMLSMPTNSAESTPSLSRDTLRFDEYTLRDMRAAKLAIPAITDHVMSAMTVVVRGLLDMYLDQTIEKEQVLMTYLRHGMLESGSVHLRGSTTKEDSPALSHTPRHINRIYQITATLQDYLASSGELTSPQPLIILAMIHKELKTLISTVVDSPADMNTSDLPVKIIKVLREFRVTLNQFGFSLILEYIAGILTNSPLPYEAFITIRRIFLKIEFGLPISTDSQRLFVTYLDDALESDSGGMRIPFSIINIILGLTRALKDPTCLIKAKNTITRGMKFLPNTDEAEKALHVLNDILPPAPALELFSSHMYTDIKLDKSTQPKASSAAVDNMTIPPRQHERA